MRGKTLAAAALAAFFAAVPAAAQKRAKTTPTPAPTPAPPKVKAPCDLEIVAGGVLTMDPTFRLLSEAAIVVKDGVILDIGAVPDVDANWAPAERIERKGSIVMPGLVNTHTHAAMTLMRGISDDKPLMEWLTKTIFPVEAKNVSPDFVKWGTTLACMEMVRSGTTTFADMYYFESDVAAAVETCGMRAVLGETWLDQPAPGHATLEEAQKVTRAFLEKWKGN